MKVLSILILFLSLSARAEYNGNFYNVSPNYGGGARVQGFNTNTGSNWNTTIQPNGDQSGTNSRGQMWNYNAGSGTYMNYGTGKTCTGRGYARICN